MKKILISLILTLGMLNLTYADSCNTYKDKQNEAKSEMNLIDYEMTSLLSTIKTRYPNSNYTFIYNMYNSEYEGLRNIYNEKVQEHNFYLKAYNTCKSNNIT